MASLLFSPSSLLCSCSRSRCFQARSAPRNWHYSARAAVFRSRSDRGRTLERIRRLVISFALAESDSPKSLEHKALRPLLQEIADSLNLPADYLEKLPQDLRLDLNDAAFDLSNGPILIECGQEVGALFSSLARSWEKAETSTSSKIASQLPFLEDSFNDSVNSAIGKRLLGAGRRFQGMGKYREGELLRVHASARILPCTIFILSRPFLSLRLIENVLFSFIPSKLEKKIADDLFPSRS